MGLYSDAVQLLYDNQPDYEWGCLASLGRLKLSTRKRSIYSWVCRALVGNFPKTALVTHSRRMLPREVQVRHE